MYLIQVDNKNNIVNMSIITAEVVPEGWIEVTEQQYKSIELPAKLEFEQGQAVITNIAKAIVYTEEIIDAETVELIRKRYSIDDEMKIQRLGILDKTNANFVEYNNFVEECIQIGRNKKQSYL